MSGAVGFPPVRQFVVARPLRVIRARVDAIHHRGGFSSPVAIPGALVIASTLVWATTHFAAAWVGR